MSEMVERVAEALMGCNHDDPPARDFQEMARAAILAMREPTEGMVNAADPGYRGEPLPADMAWQRMIDEALK